MKREHTLMVRGSDTLSAFILEEDDRTFRITDGYNCGHITSEIDFPNVTTARTYLAGRWNVRPNTIELVGTKEVLTTDDRILKMVHNWHRGLCTEDELLWQLTILRSGVIKENRSIS